MSVTASTTDSSSTANLSGVVTDAVTGDTLSGISVALFDSSNHKTTATTDSSGAYSVEGLAVGEYSIEVEGDDYAPSNADVQLIAGDNVKNFKMSDDNSTLTDATDDADNEDEDDDSWTSTDDDTDGF